ncbi:hypothetical protein RRSWK_04256 [Rhodopirellula sp. SWK7]|nr:hypothetical protein RRSWK_04256 [Rhodopirellula sp. SWK7]
MSVSSFVKGVSVVLFDSVVRRIVDSAAKYDAEYSSFSRHARE